MRFRLFPLVTLFVALAPLAARADLVTIAVEGEFYSVSNEVTVGAHGLEYSASFVFDTFGEPDLVEPGRETYSNRLVSGRLSVGDLVASFGGDIANLAAIETRQHPVGFSKLVEIQVGNSSRLPPPPITQTGGTGIGDVSRMILLLYGVPSQVDTALSLDEALTEAQLFSITPIIGFRNIPGAGYHEFYSTKTRFTFDRQAVASVSVPGSALLVMCALIVLRGARRR